MRRDPGAGRSVAKEVARERGGGPRLGEPWRRRSRSRTPRTTALAVVAAILALGLTGTASVSAAEGEPGEGWAPALRFGFGLHLQGLDGNAVAPNSTLAIQTDPAFRTAGAPGDSAVTEEVRVGLRVYAPEKLLPESAFAPRLFLEGGFEKPLDDGFIASRYNFDFDILNTGGVGGDVSAFCPEAPPTQSCSYEAKTTVDILYNWWIGLGADFRLPIADGQYHLVPTLAYFGQAFESEGVFSVNLSQTLGSDEPRRITSEGDEEILHGIAAGLGLEIDVFEGESVSARIFLETRGAWLLNDREVPFSGTNPVPTVDFQSADFLVRPSGFVLTTAGGVELRFTGL